MSGIVGALAVFALLAVGLALLETLIKRSDVAAWLVLGMVAIHTTLNFSLQAEVGPLTIYAEDVVFGLLVVAAIARLLRSGRPTTGQLFLLTFGIIAVISLARGVPEFGIQSAANSFRKTFTFGAGALYFSTAWPTRDVLDRIGRAWLLVAGGLVIVVLARWAGVAAGSTVTYASGPSLRVLNATETFVLAQAFFIALPAWRRRGPAWMRVLAVLLLAAVALLQHRSVWVAVLVGLGVAVLRDHSLARRLAKLLAGGLIAGAVISFLLIDSAEVQVGENLEQSASDFGTLAWRYEGWVELLTDSGPDTPGEVALGQPFGGSFERLVAGQLRDSSPHNYYLEAFFRVGVVGIVALLAACAYALRHLFAYGDDGDDALLSGERLFLLMIIQGVYWLIYSPAETHGMVLGLAVAMAAYAARAVSAGARAELQQVQKGPLKV